jgi:hypothetical protein
MVGCCEAAQVPQTIQDMLSGLADRPQKTRICGAKNRVGASLTAISGAYETGLTNESLSSLKKRYHVLIYDLGRKIGNNGIGQR